MAVLPWWLLMPLWCVGQVQDVALKAAYIYNFALFTTWPASAAPAASFNVCATRGKPLWNSLQKLDGKIIDGRPWTTIDSAASPRPGKCDITVLPEGAPAPPSCGQASALLVSDGGLSGRSSAAITLVTEDEHVRFDIDTQEAAHCGLKFSSKLLRLARNVQ